MSTASPRIFASTIRNSPIPRAMLSVQAMADRAGVGSFADLNAAFVEFKASHEARYDKIEAGQRSIEDLINKGALSAAAGQMGGGAGGLPVEPEYTSAFASYTRSGAADAEASLRAANAIGDRQSIQAAMSVGDNSSGGYLAPVEWDRQIQKAQRSISPMRRLARVVLTSRAAYSTLWNNNEWGTGWVGETASRPATATPALTPLVIPSGEIYANAAVTQRMLDDSAINLEEWLGSSIADEFARQEGIAFITGDGINKPMGFLMHVAGGSAALAHPAGPIAAIPSGVADALGGADRLIDLKYGLGAPYRQNATWLMNSQTAAVIAKLKDGDGNYIWREGLLKDEPATLLGRPVAIDENMPNILPGALPIAFGDFARGYVINDREGVRILRDPYSNKPFVCFYCTKRVGSGLLDPNAIRVLRIAAN